MAKLIIAAGKETQKRLKSRLNELEEIFGVDDVYVCGTTDELDAYLNKGSTLLFYSDFPATYNDIQVKVKQSEAINNVIGIEYVGDHKAWLYDGTTVANCILPEDDIPALKRAVTVPKYVNLIGQWVAALFIGSVILGTAMYAHHYQLAAQERQQETEQEINNKCNVIPFP